MRIPPMRTLRDVIAELEIQLHRSHVQEAVGWVVVTTDLESDTLVHVTGPHPSPEAAVVDQQAQYDEDRKFMVPGEVGWKHEITPMFKPTR